MKKFALALPLLLILALIAGCTVPVAPAEAPAAAPAEEVTMAEDNPYTPTDLFEAAAALKEATADGSPPAGAKFVLLTNAVAPFWTAAQIGAARASSEINVPITFQAPTAAEKLAQQLSMLETFVNDGYTGITFSSIDRERA